MVMWDERLAGDGGVITGTYDTVGDGQILIWSGENAEPGEEALIDFARTIAHEYFHHLYGSGHGAVNPELEAALAACGFGD